jgi:peptidoglycan/LPS O-acetylase OafA/YrhL
MKYRREIDGLRAIAVIPVILFHAGFEIFSGGYVGVDVFFVISGYLITCMLIDELERGDFSISNFYERRARRILPALFVVMLACLPFANMWMMMPSQWKDFSQSVVAVVFFASNVLFWREDGYFAAAAELKPLLHTWSLAVEEQYYLIFPVFMLLMWRFGRSRVFWSVVGIAGASFLLSEWGWRNRPSANFYLAPTRAWELLAGSICAFLSVGRLQRSSNMLSAAGLLLILFAIFYYDASTPFPSFYALAVVVGTALVILYGTAGTWVSWLLSKAPFVGVGLISYSAYLWHQPLFAFARLHSMNKPTPLLMAVLAVTAMLFAWATWKYVEQPFRKQSNPFPATRWRVFALSGGVGAVFVAIGLAGHAGHGFEWRLSSTTLRYAAAENDIANRACHFDNSGKSSFKHPQLQCLFSDDEAAHVMLIGDSHMGSLAEGVRDALIDEGIGNYFVSHTSCLPLLGFETHDPGKTYNCNEFINGAFEWAKNTGVTTVVLAARFTLYLNGNRYNNKEGGLESGGAVWVDLVGRSDSNLNDDERRVRVLNAYEQGIRELAHQFNVVIVYPVPEAGWSVPFYALKNVIKNGEEAKLTTPYAAYKERTSEVNALFDRLVADVPNVYAARVHEVLCSNATGRCVNADARGIYYYDDDHLSNAGARRVAPVIVKAIQDALSYSPKIGQ